MSTQVQYRRGTATENNAFTGALAEITVDTTNWTLRVHDGVTAGGGGNIATVAYVSAQLAALSANAITFGTSNVQIPSSGGNVRVNVGGTANVGVFSSTGLAITGDLSVTGNATLSGNILGDRVQNGTTSFDIQTQNGNANISVGGTSNVAVFATTGVFVSGLSSVTGNITGGNILTGGLISATGTVTGSQFNGSGAGLTSIPAANVTGTLSVNTTGSAATLTTARNINGVAFNGSADITVTAAAGTLTGTTLNSTVVTSSLTSVGALNSGSITSGFGSIDIGTDTVTCGGIVNANANGVGNIGSATTYFNTVFAKATSAQYADLAEMYAADANYEPGTVVDFGGTHEITISTQSHSTAVAGIISTNPSYLMNSTQAGEHVLPVALTGRVPCRVQGPVNKGDVLVTSSTPGVAQRISMNWQPGCVLGKSLESITGSEIKTIEVAVGRF